MRWRVIVAVWILTSLQAHARPDAKPALTFRDDSPGQCLSGPTAGPPSYPDGAASGAGGVVRAHLSFTSLDAPPRVDVYTNTAGAPFGESVSAHVAKYRATCAEALGQQLAQEFQFVPGTTRVLPSVVRSSRAIRDRAGCDLQIPPRPDYPLPTALVGGSNIDRESLGRVLLRMTFEGPGAPGVIVLASGGPRRFEATAVEHAVGYRLKCSDASAYPVTGVLPYVFMIDGETPPEFKALTLTELLRAVDRIETQHAYFDFTNMGCPFEASIYPLQPAYPNIVPNTGARAEDRREFFAWLETLQVRLPPKAPQALKGSAITVSVPCAVLNLL